MAKLPVSAGTGSCTCLLNVPSASDTGRQPAIAGACNGSVRRARQPMIVTLTLHINHLDIDDIRLGRPRAPGGIVARTCAGQSMPRQCQHHGPPGTHQQEQADGVRHKAWRDEQCPADHNERTLRDRIAGPVTLLERVTYLLPCTRAFTTQQHGTEHTGSEQQRDGWPRPDGGANLTDDDNL